ncbi:MAG: DUF779 domain-containing protein [Propionibacteriaceae bacterium]|nr:DUF779 domain-containing protein [Propionibacteriaceae bacterium]
MPDQPPSLDACRFDAVGVEELVTDGPARVAVTPAAASLLRTVVARHGPVMFHQSGGCCDGSAPMCYPVGDFLTGDADVLLGTLAVPGLDPIEVWIGRAQYAAWKHTRLTIDAVPGRGAGFSLEAPEGQRFLTRSRLFTPDEADALGL